MMSKCTVEPKYIYVGIDVYDILIEEPMLRMNCSDDRRFGYYCGSLMGINVYIIHDIKDYNVFISSLEPDEFYKHEFKVKIRQDKLKNIK